MNARTPATLPPHPNADNMLSGALPAGIARWRSWLHTWLHSWPNGAFEALLPTHQGPRRYDTRAGIPSLLMKTSSIHTAPQWLSGAQSRVSAARSAFMYLRSKMVTVEWFLRYDTAMRITGTVYAKKHIAKTNSYTRSQLLCTPTPAKISTHVRKLDCKMVMKEKQCTATVCTRGQVACGCGVRHRGALETALQKERWKECDESSSKARTI
jgi:hypothetical protein